MARQTLILILAVAWACLFAGSFVYAHFTAPTDMGFTRGLNRVVGFLGWQGLATLAALAALIAGFGLPKEARAHRWLSRAPIIGELCLVAAIGAMIVYALVTQTPPQDMPPAIEPAEPTFG